MSRFALETGVSIARESIAANVLVWYGRGLYGCCTRFQCQGKANLSNENTRSTLGVACLASVFLRNCASCSRQLKGLGT